MLARMTTKAWAAAIAALIAAALLAPPAFAANDRDRTQWDHVARVVAIGDLHGDFDKFHDQLRQAGLIDGKDGSVGFQILGDGKELFKTGTLKEGKLAEFKVDVTGVKELQLITNDGGDGNRLDWGAWLAPMLAR